ncbi:hypothetical protein ACERII_21565 [Evansella sp. AB-rgal1]|uniref:hypothetical protein n=1 Tax=Evansella sp. AB-rgal1 TaxID=3242696 RepID=UPI00359DD952
MLYYFHLYWHFIVVIISVFVLSGVISYIFPRLNFVVIVITSGLIGYYYSSVIEVKDLALISTGITSVSSLLAIGVARYALFLKHKGEELEDLENNN